MSLACMQIQRMWEGAQDQETHALGADSSLEYHPLHQHHSHQQAFMTYRHITHAPHQAPLLRKAVPPIWGTQPGMCQIPWQIGDGKAEGKHLAPAQIEDELKGKLDDEPWQFKPYAAGDTTWLHAAQRRHAHRRRANTTLGVASVDLSGPHLATPMPGQRLGQAAARYFVVLVVRPDLSGLRKDAAMQTDAPPPPGAGGAHVDHEAAENANEEELEIRTYNPAQPLLYVEIIETRGKAAEAVMKMIAQMREELGNFPAELPSH